MTIHLSFSYQCGWCQQPYLPFSEEQRICPKCGETAPDNVVAPRIKEIVEAARYNQGFPFLILSLADIYVMNAMHCMESVERGGLVPHDSVSLEATVRHLSATMSLGRDGHMRNHMETFIREILQEAYL